MPFVLHPMPVSNNGQISHWKQEEVSMHPIPQAVWRISLWGVGNASQSDWGSGRSRVSAWSASSRNNL